MIYVAPPAGFEPAHTVPERTALYPAELRRLARVRSARARTGHSQLDRSCGAICTWRGGLARAGSGCLRAGAVVGLGAGLGRVCSGTGRYHMPTSHEGRAEMLDLVEVAVTSQGETDR